MNGRQRLLSTIAGQPVDRLAVMPITMMFATDQIGEPYGAYARDYRVLAAAQLRTAERFELDHVSTISDPAREAADCGAAVRYFDDQPPAIDETSPRLHEPTLAGLRQPDPLGGGRMHDRILAVEALRRGAANQLLVEGWVEGPVAEAADLRGINQLMLDFGDEPAFVADLMTWCVELACSFASAQLAAGADIIGIGDAAASLVGPAIYEEFVWPAERRLIEHVHRHGGRTRLHICGNTTPLLSLIGRLGSDTVDIDYLTSLQSARNAMPGQVLAGNLDPVRVLRNGTPQRVTDAVARCHGDAGSRFIVAAGCEVPRDTEPANLAALVGYARCRPDGLALEGGVRA